MNADDSGINEIDSPGMHTQIELYKSKEYIIEILKILLNKSSIVYGAINHTAEKKNCLARQRTMHRIYRTDFLVSPIKLGGT